MIRQRLASRGGERVGVLTPRRWRSPPRGPAGVRPRGRPTPRTAAPGARARCAPVRHAASRPSPHRTPRPSPRAQTSRAPTGPSPRPAAPRPQHRRRWGSGGGERVRGDSRPVGCTGDGHDRRSGGQHPCYGRRQLPPTSAPGAARLEVQETPLSPPLGTARQFGATPRPRTGDGRDRCLRPGAIGGPDLGAPGQSGPSATLVE